jgi:hypothetical protein
MKKLLTAVLAAICGVVLFAPAIPAGALAGFDTSVSISDSPDPVTPVGGTTIYKVVAAATGTVPLFAADLTVTISGGKYAATGTTAPGCDNGTITDGTANPTFHCQVAPTSTGAVTLYFAIKSTTAGSMSASGNIAYNPTPAHPIIDDNPANDNDTETTTVTNGSSSASYVPPGGTLTYQSHTMTVYQSATGVITEMKNANANGATCGSTSCKQGLRVLFYDNTVYSGRTRIDLNFGGTNPCQGQAAATCKPIYYRKASTGAVTASAQCVTPADKLCWESKTFVPFPGHPAGDMDADDGNWHLVVRVDSSDPDLLAPARSLTTGTAPAG